MLRKSKFKTVVWYSGVGLLVLFAIAVTLFRVFFSSVAEYRSRLEVIAEEYLGQPVTISGMDARVVGLSPTVVLTELTLLHKNRKEQLTRFDDVYVSLDPIGSLLSGSPIIELTVSGASLELTRHRDGTFGVQGLQLATAGDDDQKIPQAVQQGAVAEKGKALGGWFLSQNRLAVRDSHITLHDAASGERFSFENVELELRNDGERHRLSGFVHLPRTIGRGLQVAADIEGNPLQNKAWQGDFYLKAEQVQPRHWLQQLSWQGSALHAGIFDLEMWGHWGDGQAQSLRASVAAAGLLLVRDKQKAVIPHLSADAQLLRQQGGWQLNVADLRIQHGEMPAQPMRLSLSKQDDALTLQANRLQLDALAALLPYLPRVDETTRAMVKQMAPAGVLKAFHLRQVAGQPLQLHGAVERLIIRPWQKLPGVGGFDASFHYSGDRGKLELNVKNAVIALPKLFRESIPIYDLNGTLRLQREANGWQLQGESLSVRNHDLSAELAMELRLEEGKAPWLGLQGRFDVNSATAVPRYLPAGIMKEKSLQWLDNAFRAGTVPRGALQYHGYVNHFPFRDKQGRFEVLFDAEAVQLHYQDGWPDLQQLAGEVHFDGPGMWINGHAATIFGARIGSSMVSIENFAAPRLLVDSTADFPAEDGLRFLNESPLSRHTGDVLETIQAQGDASLLLQLAIPLSQQVSESMPLSVKGNVDFAANQVDLIEGISLKGMEGSLQFTEDKFTADSLQAQLWGKPVSLAVLTEQGERPRVMVAARGRSSMEDLQAAFKLPLLAHLNGESDWQTSISLPRGDSSEGVLLRVSSTLEGVASELPQPLAKQSAESQDMQLLFYLSGPRKGERQLLLDKRLGLAWAESATDEADSVRRAQLRLGGTAPLALPSQDVIEIRGKVSKLRLGPWLELMRTMDGEAGRSQQLPSVKVQMSRLELLGQAPSAESPSIPELSFNEWPRIDFAVDNFSYDDLRLGKLSMQLIPKADSLLINKLSATSPTYSLSGNGKWKRGGNTSFKLALKSPELGKLLSHFGFASVIEGGVTEASANIGWSGSPIEPSLQKLQGELSLHVKEGSIVDVDPGAGRMLGALSLSALPKRLFLDFSDVFKKGLAFDVIKGEIRLDSGHAHTTNLRLESSSADILMTGRTGLVAQDFDQDIYVMPKVQGTATVASALAWGPQVAAVVALVQQVFKSDIKEATMIHYHMSGSWQKPKIKRMDQKPKVKKEEAQEQQEPLFLE